MSYSIAPSLLEIFIISQKADYFSLSSLQNDLNGIWKNALIINNPTYPSGYTDLKGAEKEIDLILPFIDKNSSIILKGKEATYEKVIENIEQRDLLYFATHGIANMQNALDSSFLILATNGEKKLFTLFNYSKFKFKSDRISCTKCLSNRLG